MRIATAQPSPVCCTVDTPVNTKVAKTVATVTAAAVIVRALLTAPRPPLPACRRAPPSARGSGSAGTPGSPSRARRRSRTRAAAPRGRCIRASRVRAGPPASPTGRPRRAPRRRPPTENRIISTAFSETTGARSRDEDHEREPEHEEEDLPHGRGRLVSMSRQRAAIPPTAVSARAAAGASAVSRSVPPTPSRPRSQPGPQANPRRPHARRAKPRRRDRAVTGPPHQLADRPDRGLVRAACAVPDRTGAVRRWASPPSGPPWRWPRPHPRAPRCRPEAGAAARP